MAATPKCHQADCLAPVFSACAEQTLANNDGSFLIMPCARALTTAHCNDMFALPLLLLLLLWGMASLGGHRLTYRFGVHAVGHFAW